MWALLCGGYCASCISFPRACWATPPAPCSTAKLNPPFTFSVPSHPSNCSNLFGALTHYASGPAAVFHGSGYMALGEVLGVGALMGLRNVLVWGVAGMAWWKFLGWW